MRYYTGVGSRATPAYVMEMMEEIAIECEKKDLILRSGGADGADTAFENGAGESKEIYIPWKGFNGSSSFRYESSPEAEKIARTIHPKWGSLSYGGKALHTRNVHQVLGQNLNEPSDFLVCWTENAKDVGGTATAIKLARKNNIPIFNLGNLIEYDKVMRHLKDNY